jgi:hypothetical protein
VNNFLRTSYHDVCCLLYAVIYCSNFDRWYADADGERCIKLNSMLASNRGGSHDVGHIGSFMRFVDLQ